MFCKRWRGKNFQDVIIHKVDLVSVCCFSLCNQKLTQIIEC